MKIKSGNSASVYVMATWLFAGLYNLMSKLHYKQTQDLTRVFVIFNNKNFHLHWIFRKADDDPTPCMFRLPVFHLELQEMDPRVLHRNTG
jgi:hypothetical protein